MDALKEFSWKKLTILMVALVVVLVWRPELGEQALDLALAGVIAIGVVDVAKVVCKTLISLKDSNK